MTLAEVHSALAYYYDHKDEIEASFEEDDKSEREHEARKAEYLKQRAAMTSQGACTVLGK